MSSVYAQGVATTASSATTRERILTATIELFRAQGFNGTSLAQIVHASASTTGSVYHFFPGGKDELAAEVLRVAGAAYGELVELIMRDGANPAVGMSDAFAGAATLLIESDFIDPCPIGTVAREVASTHEPLRLVAHEVMSAWVDRLSAVFTDAGVAEAKAISLATFAVASIEGGFILARTQRDVAPFLGVGDMLAELIDRELP